MLQEEHYFDPSFRPVHSGRRYYEYFASFPPVRRAADLRETAGDGAVAGVLVEHCRHAVPDAIQKVC